MPGNENKCMQNTCRNPIGGPKKSMSKLWLIYPFYKISSHAHEVINVYLSSALVDEPALRRSLNILCHSGRRRQEADPLEAEETCLWGRGVGAGVTAITSSDRSDIMHECAVVT